MTDFRTSCAELLAALDAYPLRPAAHRMLCNRVRSELAATEKEPLIENRWYWVQAGDDDWFPAKRAGWAGGGWCNEDCWEDWDRKVVDWRLIPLPDEKP